MNAKKENTRKRRAKRAMLCPLLMGERNIESAGRSTKSNLKIHLPSPKLLSENSNEPFAHKQPIKRSESYGKVIDFPTDCKSILKGVPKSVKRCRSLKLKNRFESFVRGNLKDSSKLFVGPFKTPTETKKERSLTATNYSFSFFRKSPIRKHNKWQFQV